MKDVARAGMELLRAVEEERRLSFADGWNACRKIVEELTDDPLIIAAMRRDTDKDG